MSAPAQPQKTQRRSPLKPSSTYLFALTSTCISFGIIALILLTLIIQSGPVIFESAGSLLSTHWSPADNIYGIVPMLFGSVTVMIIALALALPIGGLAAIAISEIKTARRRQLIKSTLEILASIPSIVYGLIAVAYVSLWVADMFDLQSGRIILTAGIILSVMILPTFLSLSEDAIKAVPKAYKENAAALGLYQHETIVSAVLPAAAPGIAAAALLALGRALGETMAVMLVIGSLDRLPDPIFNVLSSGQTITSKLGREVGESAFGSTHFSALVLMSLILVCITLSLTFAAQRLFKPIAS